VKEESEGLTFIEIHGVSSKYEFQRSSDFIAKLMKERKVIFLVVKLEVSLNKPIKILAES